MRSGFAHVAGGVRSGFVHMAVEWPELELWYTDRLRVCGSTACAVACVAAEERGVDGRHMKRRAGDRSHHTTENPRCAVRIPAADVLRLSVVTAQNLLYRSFCCRHMQQATKNFGSYGH